MLAAVAAVIAVALALLALVVLQPAEEEQQSGGREHAEAACDLTSKASEAADVETDARLAAAVLLLDQAIIASAHAAESDVAYAELDEAVQAVHTAGHQGDPQPWQEALDTALAACQTAND